MTRTPRRPDPPPLATNDAVTVGVGTVIWAATTVSLLAILGTLHSSGHGWWVQCGLVGTGLGLVGLGFLQRRDRRHPRAGTPQAAGTGARGRPAPPATAAGRRR